MGTRRLTSERSIYGSVEEEFYIATRDMKYVIDVATRQEKLELHALKKQAILGDCCIAQPYVLDIKAMRKWTAWKALYGMNKYEAMERYMDKVSELFVLQYG